MKCPVKLSNNERGITQYNLCRSSGRINTEYDLFITNKRVILASSSNSFASSGTQVNEIDINNINSVSTSIKKKANIFPSLLLLILGIVFSFIPNNSDPYEEPKFNVFLIVGIVMIILAVICFLLSIYLAPKTGSIILCGEKSSNEYLSFSANTISKRKNKNIIAKITINRDFSRAQSELGALIKDIQEENKELQNEIKEDNNAIKDKDQKNLEEDDDDDSDEIPEL